MSTIRLNEPGTLVVMGVSGSGKSRIGAMLATALRGTFEDADDFHPASNKARMSAGIPLTDADRWPWYETLRARIVEMRKLNQTYVLACSALKAAYRDRLRGADPGENISFVLLRGSRATLRSRLAGRKGHFMPPALLESQLATLEETPDLVAVSIDQTPEAIVAEILRRLGMEGGSA